MIKKGKRGRGRPPFKPTAVHRRKVSTGAAFGMTHEALAMLLEIDRETLEKYFARELSVGASRKRMEVLEWMRAAAEKGNVTAQKALLLQTMPAYSPPPATAEQKARADAAALIPAGKKEQQQRDAETAHVGSEWEKVLTPAGRVQ